MKVGTEFQILVLVMSIFLCLASWQSSLKPGTHGKTVDLIQHTTKLSRVYFKIFVLNTSTWKVGGKQYLEYLKSYMETVFAELWIIRL